MGTLAGAKTIKPGFSNEEVWWQATYDFAADGGEVEDNIVFTADGDYVITGFYAYVETAVTSDGDPAVDLGVGAGGTEIWSDVAKATLALNAVVPMATETCIKLADAGTIQLGVETAALTAGKIHFFLKVRPLWG